MFDFKEKRALITGATRGIGKAVATAFLASGATVLGVYATDRKAADLFRIRHNNEFPGVDSPGRG